MIHAIKRQHLSFEAEQRLSNVPFAQPMKQELGVVCLTIFALFQKCNQLKHLRKATFVSGFLSSQSSSWSVVKHPDKVIAFLKFTRDALPQEQHSEWSSLNLLEQQSV
ncbi:hypothetical protein D918_06442 [Trichuris suis]|nr:hypothetical protein D918_06442 [Trichuris suis]